MPFVPDVLRTSVTTLPNFCKPDALRRLKKEGTKTLSNFENDSGATASCIRLDNVGCSLECLQTVSPKKALDQRHGDSGDSLKFLCGGRRLGRRVIPRLRMSTQNLRQPSATGSGRCIGPPSRYESQESKTQLERRSASPACPGSLRGLRSRQLCRLQRLHPQHSNHLQHTGKAETWDLKYFSSEPHWGRSGTARCHDPPPRHPCCCCFLDLAGWYAARTEHIQDSGLSGDGSGQEL